MKHLKWITKKHDKTIVILFLLLLVVISVLFGYIYGNERNKYSTVNRDDIEGFGEFKKENSGKVDDNYFVRYSFNSKNQNDVGNEKSIKVLNTENILQNVNTRIHYYQIRFPYNAIRFKMKQLKLSFRGVKLVGREQGTISISLRLHKYYDKENDFIYEYIGNSGYDNQKNIDNNKLVRETNKIFTKEIFKKEFCPPGQECGSNTTLTGDELTMVLEEDELPDTIITDYHAIWIGGNSVIKYKTVTIDIVGDVSGVEQVFRISKLATKDKKTHPVRNKQTINQKGEKSPGTVREVASYIMNDNTPLLPYKVTQLVLENDYSQKPFNYHLFFDIQDMYPFDKLFNKDIYLKSIYYHFNNAVSASGNNRVTVDNKVTFSMDNDKLCEFRFKKTELNHNGDYFDISGNVGINKLITTYMKPIRMDLLKYVHSHEEGHVATNYYLRMNMLDIKYEIR